MKSKRILSFHIQTNLEGGYDIVQNVSQGKIVAHTESSEAAHEIIKILTAKYCKI